MTNQFPRHLGQFAALFGLSLAVVFAGASPAGAADKDICSDCPANLRIETSLEDWDYVESTGAVEFAFDVVADEPLASGMAEVTASISCDSGASQVWKLDAFTTDGTIVVRGKAGSENATKASGGGNHRTSYAVLFERDPPSGLDRCVLSLGASEGGVGGVDEKLLSGPMRGKGILGVWDPEAVSLERHVVIYQAGQTLPAIAWQSPPTQSVFEAGDGPGPELLAAASAPASSIARIELLRYAKGAPRDSASLLEADAASPYEFSINSEQQPLDQELYFVARLITSDGLVRYSAPWGATFVANLPPRLELSAPLHRHIYRTSEGSPTQAMVMFDAAEVGASGAIDYVEWFLDGQLMEGYSELAFEHELPVGQHSVRLVAFDFLGAESHYGPVDFEVRSSTDDLYRVSVDELSFQIGFGRQRDDGWQPSYANLRLTGMFVGAEATLRLLPLFGELEGGGAAIAAVACEGFISDGRGEKLFKCSPASYDVDSQGWNAPLESLDSGPYRVSVEVRNGPDGTVTSREFETELIGPRTGCAEDVSFCGFQIALDGLTRHFDVVAGNPVVLRASVADAGEMPIVEFLVDGKVVGAPDTSAPYEAEWTPDAGVQHRVFARACRAQLVYGQQVCYYTQVAYARVVSATAPEVRIDGSSYGPGVISNHTDWRPTFTAVDRDGSIARVDLLVDGVVLASDAAAPFELPMVKLPVGMRRIEVRATDNEGRTGSDFMSLEVQEGVVLPGVTLVASVNPADGSDLLSATVEPWAANLELGRVDFHVNGTLVASDSEAPFQFAPLPGASVRSVVALAVLESQTELGLRAMSAPVNVVRENRLPVLSLLPLPASSLPYPATVNLVAEVSDDGPIGAVEFFAIRTSTGPEPFHNDSREYSLGRDTTAPFSLEWSPEPNFSYQVFARVTDAAGVTVTSAVRNLSVPSTLANLPAMDVAIVEPLNGAQIARGSSFRILGVGNRWPTGGYLKSVRFQLDGVDLITDTQEPFEAMASSSVLGAHTVQMIATDFFDQSHTREVAIEVSSSPPSVQLYSSSPSNAGVRGVPVDLEAVVTDPDSTIDQVAFFLGDSGEPFAVAIEEPYTAEFTPSQLGDYELRAVATSADGDTGEDTLTLHVENVLPTVTWTSPAGGALFLAPATITLDVMVIDPDSAASRVDFYVGALKVAGEQYEAGRYRAVVPDLAAGKASLRAEVFDRDGGMVSVSRSVDVVANTAPAVSFVTPTADQPPYTRGGSISVEIAVADAESAFAPIEYVELFVDGVSTSQDTTAPYTFELPVPSATGPHVLRAVARDREFSPHAERTIVVNNTAPAATWLTPAAGQNFAQPAQVSASVDAIDADGSITRVEFRLNGGQLLVANTAPFAVTWSNVTIPAGEASPYRLTLTAVAYDNETPQAASAVVTRDVWLKTNAPPVVGMLSPLNGEQFFVGDDVTLMANVTDADTATAAVKFYRRLTPSGTETFIGDAVREGTSSRWRFDWANVQAPAAPGDYYIFARATDQVGGGTADAAAVRINVRTNTPPDVLTHFESESTLRCNGADGLQSYPSVPLGRLSFIVREGEQRRLCARVQDLEQNIAATQFYLSRTPRAAGSTQLPVDRVLLGTAAAPTSYPGTIARVESPQVTIPAGFSGGDVVYIWIVANDSRTTEALSPAQIETVPVAVVAPGVVPVPCQGENCDPVRNHIVATLPGEQPELHLEFENYDQGGQGLGFFDANAFECESGFYPPLSKRWDAVEINCPLSNAGPPLGSGPNDARGDYVRLSKGEYVLFSLSLDTSTAINVRTRRWYPTNTIPVGLDCSSAVQGDGSRIGMATKEFGLDATASAPVAPEETNAVTATSYRAEDQNDCLNQNDTNNWYWITQPVSYNGGASGAVIPSGDLYLTYARPSNPSDPYPNNPNSEYTEAYIDWIEFERVTAGVGGKSASFLAPTRDGEAFALGRPITFALGVSGSEGHSVSVRYQMDGQEMCPSCATLTTPPYTQLHTPVESGPHTYRAVVTYTPTAGGSPEVVYAPPLSSSPLTLSVHPAPSVAWVSTSQTVLQGSSVDLRARGTCGKVSDPASAVSTMEFTIDGAALRISGGQPVPEPACTSEFSWALSNLEVGVHRITARAIDSRGVQSELSPEISITVEAAPATFVVAMATTPTTYEAGATVTLRSTVTGAPGSITSVEYYNGTQKIGNASACGDGQFCYAWVNVGPGNYGITARATAGGFSKSSAPQALRVDAASGVNETFYFHHTNLQGSVVATTNDRGDLVAAAHYRPFGIKQNYLGGAPLARQGFTGKPEDPDLGLIYFGARYYDPQLSRFTSIDPVDFSDSSVHSFNRYAYANNSPMLMVDPDGREAGCITLGTSCGFGTVSEAEALNRLSFAADFTPVIGDIKGFVEAYQDPTLPNILGAGIGLIPVVGDIGGKLIKNADHFASAGKIFTSSDPLVGELATKIDSVYPGHVVGVNVPVHDAAGNLVTDADILLTNGIVQVKSGGGKGLAGQIQRTEAATGLPTIGYGPDLKPSVQKSCTATTCEASLIEVIRP